MKPRIRWGHGVLLRFDEPIYLELRRISETAGKPLATYLADIIVGAMPMLLMADKVVRDAKYKSVVNVAKGLRQMKKALMQKVSQEEFKFEKEAREQQRRK